MLLPCSQGKIQISAGFWLLIVWFAVVNGCQLLAVILGAAAIHELGHWSVLRLLGAKISGIQVGILGAVMTADCRHLSYGRELVAILAGPAANFLCGVILAHCGMDAAAGAHLILGGFNLLPIRPLDGGQALYLAAAFLVGPMAAEGITRWIAILVAVLLAGMLIWLMVCTGGSLWLIPAGAGLLSAAAGEFLRK